MEAIRRHYTMRVLCILFIRMYLAVEKNAVLNEEKHLIKIIITQIINE